MRNAVTALITFLCVFFCAFDLIGLTYLLNEVFGGFKVEVNAVSVVNMVMFIGLAVEFSVHIIISY